MQQPPIGYRPASMAEVMLGAPSSSHSGYKKACKVKVSFPQKLFSCCLKLFPKPKYTSNWIRKPMFYSSGSEIRVVPILEIKQHVKAEVYFYPLFEK